MFRYSPMRSALLSSLVTLLLLLAILGFPGASVGQATSLSSPAAAPPICDTAPTFDPAHFPSPNALPKTGEGTMYPLVPGTQYVLEGVANDGSGLA